MGSTLAHLNISSNALCNEGAAAIAQAFQYNSGLESLDVINCGIRDEGMTALAESLTRTSMYRFHAWGNEFGENACHRFADLVERHPYLKDLDFLVTNVDGRFGVASVPAA